MKPPGARHAAGRALLTVAIIGAAGVGAAQTPPDQAAAMRLVEAHAALQRTVDAFEATDLEGRSVVSRDLRGRVVVLDFWATWCAPCLAEIPRLRQARRRYGDRLAIVGISLDVLSRSDLVAWLRRHEVTWPQVYDGRGWSSPVVQTFGLEAIPFSVLVDAEGRVAGVNVTGPRLDRTLDALLGPG